LREAFPRRPLSRRGILFGTGIDKEYPMPKKESAAAPPTRDKAYYDALSDTELDKLWKNRVKLKITGTEELLLRHLLRERKGFKPVETFVSICQRCNLPADNCACHR